MIGASTGSWMALLALGAFHGVNPAMGWLLAVGIGMQRESRPELWRALLCIALGHTLAIALALVLLALLGVALPGWAIQWMMVLLLIAIALRQWRGHRHPAAGGMRIGARDLVVWSFLIATAHGAGVMVVPFATRMAANHSMHLARAMGPMQRTTPGSPWKALSATLNPWYAMVAAGLHTAGFLLVTAGLAVLVYEGAGLRALRRAWINLDLIWALSLLWAATMIAMQ